MNVYEFLQNTSKNDYNLRHELIPFFSFAVPNEESIKEIVKYSPIIEIGAGSGYWAFLISEYNGEIVAFDNGWRDMMYFHNDGKKYYKEHYFDVKIGNEKQIRKFPTHTLFLCWIEYLADYGLKALKLYKGKTLIYIGELEGGCCADNRFFKYLRKNFREKKEIELPQWAGIHDTLIIFERF